MPASARAATLFVSPSSASVSVGSTVQVSVMVDSEGVSINNAEGTLHVPPQFEIVSISRDSSVFSLWVEPPAAGAGGVSFDGGLPSPGYAGAQGRLFSVVLRAISPGDAMVSVSGASVRANDGMGTDVLRATAGSYLSATQPPASVPAPAAPATSAGFEAPQGISIGSPTHPDQGSWYASKAPLVQWTLARGVDAVQTLVSRNEGTTPIVTYKPPIKEKQLEDLDDGTWYFNVRAHTARGWGDVYSYKFQIDATAPALSDVSVAYSDGALTVSARAFDAGSGIAKAQVWVDGAHAFDADASQLAAGVRGQISYGPGGHTAALRVADAAGNTAASDEIAFEVPVPPGRFAGIEGFARSLAWSALLPLAVPLAVLSLLLNAWLWMRLRRLERRASKSASKSGDKFQRAARQKLSGVKKDLQQQLRELERAHKRPDITPADAAHINKVRARLQETQKYIEQKIEEVEKP